VSAPPTQPRTGDRENKRRLDARTIIPALVILALIVVPILIWTTSSGGNDDELRIDEGVSLTGGPEIIVNVPPGRNTPAEAGNSTNVKLICADGGGDTVLAADADWPFINEPGYPLPHVHQAVSPEQLQEIAKCRLNGTKTKLEGPLRRSSRN
jgi:hypothetical protein